jgi:hypothetical protein
MRTQWVISLSRCSVVHREILCHNKMKAAQVYRDLSEVYKGTDTFVRFYKITGYGNVIEL